MDQPELSAAQLRYLESARGGDVDAFGALVHANYPDVRVFMAMHLGKVAYAFKQSVGNTRSKTASFGQFQACFIFYFCI